MADKSRLLPIERQLLTDAVLDPVMMDVYNDWLTDQGRPRLPRPAPHIVRERASSTKLTCSMLLNQHQCSITKFWDSYWARLAMTTAPANKDLAVAEAVRLYELGGWKTPSTIIWAPSPQAAVIEAIKRIWGGEKRMGVRMADNQLLREVSYYYYTCPNHPEPVVSQEEFDLADSRGLHNTYLRQLWVTKSTKIEKHVTRAVWSFFHWMPWAGSTHYVARTTFASTVCGVNMMPSSVIKTLTSLLHHCHMWWATDQALIFSERPVETKFRLDSSGFSLSWMAYQDRAVISGLRGEGKPTRPPVE